MKGIQVRWPRRPWNRASLTIQRPGNTALRRCGHPHWSEAVHRHVVSTSSHEQPRVRLTSVCISTTISFLYFLFAGLEGEALFHGLRGHLTWIPFITSMGISKFTCVWDPSRNGHGISCQNCSCLWYYSKHTRDICQGAAESCAQMSYCTCIEVGGRQFEQLL